MDLRSRPSADAGFSATMPAPCPEARRRLIQRIRRQIAEGTYDAERKLDVAIRELAGDLDLRPRRSSRSVKASVRSAGSSGAMATQDS